LKYGHFFIGFTSNENSDNGRIDFNFIAYEIPCPA
jgi:hypothetical protein